jgi:hypothetical protein
MRFKIAALNTLWDFKSRPEKLLKIWEIHITELCGRVNLSENLEAETEQ